MKGTLRTLDPGRNCHSRRVRGAGMPGILPREEETEDPLISPTLEVLSMTALEVLWVYPVVSQAACGTCWLQGSTLRCSDSVGLQGEPESSMIAKFLCDFAAQGLWTHHQCSKQPKPMVNVNVWLRVSTKKGS